MDSCGNFFCSKNRLAYYPCVNIDSNYTKPKHLKFYIAVHANSHSLEFRNIPC